MLSIIGGHPRRSGDRTDIHMFGSFDMRSFTFVALAVAALVASPTLAKDKKPVDPNKKICRQSEVTGSIMMGKSVCHTAAEWAQVDRQNASDSESARAILHRGSVGAH